MRLSPERGVSNFFPHLQSLHFLRWSKMNLTKTTEYFMLIQQAQMAYVSIKNSSQAVKEINSTVSAGRETELHVP